MKIHWCERRWRDHPPSYRADIDRPRVWAEIDDDSAEFPAELRPHFKIDVGTSKWEFRDRCRHGGAGGGDPAECLARAKQLAEEWMLELSVKIRATWRKPRAPVTGKRRDTQKARLYRADDALNPFAVPLPTVKDVERYTRKVWASKRVQDAFPKATGRGLPDVRDGRGRRSAAAHSGMITIPLHARNSAIVLHELAHTVAMREHGPTIAGHGQEYCAVFLKLVLYMMGREAHDALKASMQQHRVRFRPKRARAPMAPERRAELLARLAAARLAKAACK